MSMYGLSLALLLFVSPAVAQTPASAPAEKPQAAAPDKSVDKPVADASKAADAQQTAGKVKVEELPEFRIWCVRVLDRSRFSFGRSDDADSPSKTTPDASDVTCLKNAAQNLVGTGDVLIVLDPPTYKAFEAYQEKKGGNATLLINGVDLGDDAERIGIERFPDRTVLRYSIRPGANSKRLWASLYRAAQVTALHPLNAALGFTSGPVTVGTTGASAMIAITSSFSFWSAMAAIAILVSLALYQGQRTDLFRDAKTPLPFARAWAARKELDNGAAKEDDVLRRLDPTYSPVDKPACLALAEQALKDGPKEMDPGRLAVGLVLLREKWKSARPSYSLGRVQMGMWFVFALATGIFLWLVYGALPEIDNSVLALLGLSVGVNGVSLVIDSGNPDVRFSPSNGLFKDLITSWDDKQQLYRFQAVFVNLLLLGVGILHVSQHLTYPIFDPTWLAFLGISGVALATGKSVVESKQPVS